MRCILNLCVNFHNGSETWADIFFKREKKNVNLEYNKYKLHTAFDETKTRPQFLHFILALHVCSAAVRPTMELCFSNTFQLKWLDQPFDSSSGCVKYCIVYCEGTSKHFKQNTEVGDWTWGWRVKKQINLKKTFFKKPHLRLIKKKYYRFLERASEVI